MIHARPSLTQPFCAVLSYVAGVGYATYCGGRFERAVEVVLEPDERCGGCWQVELGEESEARARHRDPLTFAALRTYVPVIHPLDTFRPVARASVAGTVEPDPPSDSDTPPDDHLEMTVEGLGADAVVPASLAELETEEP